MNSGGWPSAGPRHGRHRRGSVNSAWTPAVRPTEAGHLPAHARFDWAQPPPMDADTRPLALVPRQHVPSLVPSRREPEQAVVHVVPETPPRGLSEMAIVHVVPDTPPQGLRKFDLGIVPASVTPPRTWRKAAWFAVGTSAAVVCGLAVAAVRFVGPPPASDTIDALPAFPTQELGTLPIDETTTAAKPSTSRTSRTSTSSGDNPDTATHTSGEAPPRPGSPDSNAPGSAGSEDGTPSGETTGPGAESTSPRRTTVGPAPVTPTNPQAMGDRTERYFALVTEDPQAAHQMCTGGMAREGPEGIEARYAGVDHVEVQQITIDRNDATTTSTVKVVHENGTETVEHRQLTFTWGGDPKISDESTTG